MAIDLLRRYQWLGQEGLQAVLGAKQMDVIGNTLEKGIANHIIINGKGMALQKRSLLRAGNMEILTAANA